MDRTNAAMRAAMQALEEAFPGTGIALLMWPKDRDEQRVNYIGNCPRPDMLAAMKEIVARWEGRGHDAPKATQ
jgi:hypothetical protein